MLLKHKVDGTHGMTAEIVLGSLHSHPVYPDMHLHRNIYIHKGRGRGACLKKVWCSKEANLPTLAMSFLLRSILFQSRAPSSLKPVDHSPKR